MNLEPIISISILVTFFIIIPLIVYIIIPYLEIRTALNNYKEEKTLSRKDSFALKFYTLFEDEERKND